jgi:hypothetical protein
MSGNHGKTMSDPTTTPNAGAGQDGGQQNDASASTGAAGQTTQPAQPFAVFETAEAFKKRVDRESRKALNQQAKALGYEDWQEMSEALQPLRRGGDGSAASTSSAAATAQQPDKQKDAQSQGPSEVEKLRMALSVGQELNLPAALVGRLQGATLEEMKADAQALMGLFAAGQARGPGILPAPQTNQPVTFTRAQLQDPEFVRKNKDAILEASRQGRIVSS